MEETYREKKRREQEEFDAKINKRLMIACCLNVVALIITAICIIMTVLQH